MFIVRYDYVYVHCITYLRAQSKRACDSTPLILTGFRLQRKRSSRPTSCCGSLMPFTLSTTCRCAPPTSSGLAGDWFSAVSEGALSGRVAPTSTRATRSCFASGFGCGSRESTRPRRRSSAVRSSTSCSPEPFASTEQCTQRGVQRGTLE